MLRVPVVSGAGEAVASGNDVPKLSIVAVKVWTEVTDCHNCYQGSINIITVRQGFTGEAAGLANTAGYQIHI